MIDIIIFFIICLGLGFIINIINPKYNPPLIENLIIHFGVGLGLIPILGVLFNIIHIPIHWISFLLTSIMIGAMGSRNLIGKKINLKIRWESVVMLILVGISAFMFIGGSYKYPWFEDSDPWEFADASLFIGKEGTYSADFYFNHFAEPYPQGYQIVMGTMYQLNHSIYDTLKIFNNLIIAFASIFLFFFVYRFTKNYRIALLSGIFVWAIPAFFSHFIYSMSFTITLMMVFLYALIRRWKVVGAVLYASLLVSHFYTAMIATVFFAIIYISKMIVTKKFQKSYSQIGFYGFLLSLLFWIPAYFKYVRFDLLKAVPPVGGAELFFPYITWIILAGLLGIVIYIFRKVWFKHIKFILNKWIWLAGVSLILGVLIIPSPGSIRYVHGSGDTIYSLSDFFIAKGYGLFNNPVGIGLVIMVLFTLGIIFIFLDFKNLCLRENLCKFTSLNFALFSIAGIFGKSLSVGFIPFRMWVFFAIPCAIIAGIFLSSIIDLVQDYFPKKWMKFSIYITILLIVFSGVYLTSFKQKYELNSSLWPEHKIMNPKAIEMYHNPGLPKSTTLIGMCHPLYVVSSYDWNIKSWESKELTFYYKLAVDESVEENYKVYKKYNISYVIVDVGCILKHNVPIEKINKKIVDLENSSLFKNIKVINEDNQPLALLYQLK